MMRPLLQPYKADLTSSASLSLAWQPDPMKDSLDRDLTGSLGMLGWYDHHGDKLLCHMHKLVPEPTALQRCRWNK